MISKSLLRLANLFYVLAEAEELPANSDDLDTVLKNLQELETYAAKKRYAEANLKHLSSGSSRIVYLTNEHTVIKLAKNDKGIAQNKVEANPKMKSKFLNETLRHAKNYDWIETHFLEKITEKEFQEMTDVKFKDFGDALSYGLKKVSDDTAKKPDNFDQVSKSEIYKEMERIGKEFHVLPGDLERISSWGRKDKYPVLLDAGLTRAVYDEFYEDSSS